jgi:large subunit ribosomal protein L21
MYAVIETGGKQYRVELGSEIAVERLDVEAGQTFDLERVLLVTDGDSTAVGRPLVEGARVSASVVRQDRGEKLVVFKYGPKTRRRVKHGHRQEQTVLRVSDIVLGDRSAARIAEGERAERERLAAEAVESAEKKAAADRALADKLASAPAEATAGDAEGSTGVRPAKTSRAPRTPAAGAAGTAGSASKPGARAGKPSPKPAAGGRTQAPEPDAKAKRPTTRKDG